MSHWVFSAVLSLSPTSLVFCVQKEWREQKDEFKRKVSRIVRRSQECM